MAERATGLKMLRVSMPVFSVINVLLALNFFPFVPLLGWLNFGHANWATAWIPEVILLGVLPAGYFVYWHFWFVVVGPALLCSLYVWRWEGSQEAKVWTVVSGVALATYLVARIVLDILGVRPDIV